jgi:hypothetical protein
MNIADGFGQFHIARGREEMKSMIQKVLGVVVIASAITVVGCDQAGENMPKGDSAKAVIPPDMPKTSEDYMKQQASKYTDTKGMMKNPTAASSTQTGDVLKADPSLAPPPAK